MGLKEPYLIEGYLGKHGLFITLIVGPDCGIVDRYTHRLLHLWACRDNEHLPTKRWQEIYEVNGIMDAHIKIEALDANDKQARRRFVDIGRAFAKKTPNSVPQLLGEQLELLNPAKNPFFLHARVQLFFAARGGQTVGRISAHIDELALTMPEEQGFGPGVGMFGYFDAADEAVSKQLLATAADWLRGEGMDRMVGPISLSIWEEPGLLVKGHEHPPIIMMGHHPAHYQAWIEGAGFNRVKTLHTYDIDTTADSPPLIERIIKSGKRNQRINLRQVRKKDWDQEAAIILSILNDAWSDNWGFIPLTPEEVAYTGVKLKTIIHEDLNMIAEVDGRPVAFMLTFPDVNRVLSKIDGRMLPFGWWHLLRWARSPVDCNVRVPLMGVLREFQSSRMASQLAFMMIDQIRRNSTSHYGTPRAEIGWILEDNQGMVAIANALGSEINREYAIYETILS